MTACLNKYKWDWRMVLRLDPSYIKYLNTFDEAFTNDDSTDNDEYPDTFHEDLSDQDIKDIVGRGQSIKEDNILDISTTEKDTESRLVPKMYLKKEYQDNIHRGIGFSKVPLLSPPKTVLDTGSEIIDVNGHYVYYVTTSKYSQGSPAIMGLQKQHLYLKDNKIGLTSHYYWFDRFRNVTREIKHCNRILVYNLNTAILYDIKYIEVIIKSVNMRHTSKKYKKIIHTIGLLNIDDLAASMVHFHSYLSELLTKYIDTFVKNLIPDRVITLKDPEPQESYLIELFGDAAKTKSRTLHQSMFQHRMGKRADWCSETDFLKSVGHLGKQYHISFTTVSKKVDNDSDETNDVVMDRRKNNTKRLYKAMGDLKKDCSPIRLVKSVMGKHYKDMYYKLLRFYSSISSIKNGTAITQILKLQEAGRLPKCLYHAISTAINSKNKSRIEHLMSCVLDITISNRDKSSDHEKMEQITAYTKFLSNIPDTLDYHTFRDTLRMAKNLRLRVRVNKFKTAEEFELLHTRLSELTNRDTRSREEYEKFVFLNLKSPAKTYSGFEFVQLQTTEELVEEGTAMHHCVGGYSFNCLNGNAIFSMRKEGRRWSTIELGGNWSSDNIDLRIVQNHSIDNKNIYNQEILAAIDTWLKDLNELYKKNHIESYEKHSKLFFKYQILLLKLKNVDVSVGVDTIYSINEDISKVAICDVSNYDSLVNAYQQLLQIEKEHNLCLGGQLRGLVEGITEDNISAEELRGAID